MKVNVIHFNQSNKNYKKFKITKVFLKIFCSFKFRALLRSIVCPMDMMLSRVPVSSTLFDIGCGTGAFLQLIAQSKNPKSLGGSETNPSLLEKSSELLQKEYPYLAKTPNFIVSDLPPTQIENYDVITLVDVLHHIPKSRQKGFLEQIHLHMRSGATFLLKDIDAASPLVIFNKIHDAIFAGNGFQERPAQEICTQLQTLGFEILHKETRRRLWYPHYLIVACKK
jgi:2-polyprenyl-3-methyl-5-hydroxy-6-metoxy-1,4-benzoquinol methylase